MKAQREMSLPEYINALGNTRHRASNEYCQLVDEIESQSKLITSQGIEIIEHLERISALEAENKQLKADRENLRIIFVGLAKELGEGNE